MLKEALGLQEENGMREHPDAALVLRSLGEVEQALGQKEEAQKHLQEALSIQLQKLPQGHPETEKTRKCWSSDRCETKRGNERANFLNK